MGNQARIEPLNSFLCVVVKADGDIKLMAPSAEIIKPHLTLLGKLAEFYWFGKWLTHVQRYNGFAWHLEKKVIFEQKFLQLNVSILTILIVEYDYNYYYQILTNDLHLTNK